MAKATVKRKLGSIEHGGRPARSLKALKRSARDPIFIAVIVREGFRESLGSIRFSSHREDDGWYALMGMDKQKLVQAALTKARGFSRATRYEVAVGRLDEMVVMPTPAFEYVTL